MLRHWQVEIIVSTVDNAGMRDLWITYRFVGTMILLAAVKVFVAVEELLTKAGFVITHENSIEILPGETDAKT